MKLENETKMSLTVGYLQAIAGLAMTQVDAYVMQADRVLFQQDVVKAPVIVSFQAKSSESTGPPYKTFASATLLFDEVETLLDTKKDARECLETLQGLVDDARAALTEAQNNVEALDVPRSMQGLVEQLVEDLREMADSMDELESAIEDYEAD